MKRGFTVLEYVIAAIIVMVFAVGTLYAFGPKLEKAPRKIIETFLPEKCAQTGKTLDEYLALITDLLLAIPPQTQQALTTYTEMKTCFVDAELPEEFREPIKQMLYSEIDKLFAEAAIKKRQIWTIYTNSKALIPLGEWRSKDLLLFARSLYPMGLPQQTPQDAREEALRLLEKILSREKNNELEAEALLLQGLWYANDPQEEKKLHDAFDAVIRKFESRQEGIFKLFVSLARMVRDQETKSIVAVEEARNSPDAGTRKLASYYLSSILVKNLPIKYCKRDIALSQKCICVYYNKKEDAIDADILPKKLQQEEFNYCCPEGSSTKPCLPDFWTAEIRTVMG